MKRRYKELKEEVTRRINEHKSISYTDSDKTVIELYKVGTETKISMKEDNGDIKIITLLESNLILATDKDPKGVTVPVELGLLESMERCLNEF